MNRGRVPRPSLIRLASRAQSSSLSCPVRMRFIGTRASAASSRMVISLRPISRPEQHGRQPGADGRRPREVERQGRVVGGDHGPAGEVEVDRRCPPGRTALGRGSTGRAFHDVPPVPAAPGHARPRSAGPGPGRGTPPAADAATAWAASGGRKPRASVRRSGVRSRKSAAILPRGHHPRWRQPTMGVQVSHWWFSSATITSPSENSTS